MKTWPINYLVLVATLVTVSSLDLTPSLWPIRITFHAYTPINNQFMRLNKINSHLHLNPRQNTVLIIHGWRDHYQSEWILKLAQSYHGNSRNYKILTLDWSKFSQLNVVNAAVISRLVGNVAGNLIGKQMTNGRIDGDNLHVIGHGLGAHIAGFLGKKVKSLGMSLDRITALDAINLAVVPKQFKLSRGDANFVDFVYNDVGIAGMMYGVGNVDFYIDSPCNLTISGNIQNLIGKQNSYVYYTEALTRKMTAVKCFNWLAFKMKMCAGETATFGEFVERNSSGSYFLNFEGISCKIFPQLLI